jgi:hypothetical protein
MVDEDPFLSPPNSQPLLAPTKLIPSASTIFGDNQLPSHCPLQIKTHPKSTKPFSAVLPRCLSNKLEAAFTKVSNSKHSAKSACAPAPPLKNQRTRSQANKTNLQVPFNNQSSSNSSGNSSTSNSISNSSSDSSNDNDDKPEVKEATEPSNSTNNNDANSNSYDLQLTLKSQSADKADYFGGKESQYTSESQYTKALAKDSTALAQATQDSIMSEAMLQLSCTNKAI